ncbi:MAG TPA: hypothetical protein VGM15_03325 [Burkholderiaceae bacterium]
MSTAQAISDALQALYAERERIGRAIAGLEGLADEGPIAATERSRTDTMRPVSAADVALTVGIGAAKTFDTWTGAGEFPHFADPVDALIGAPSSVEAQAARVFGRDDAIGQDIIPVQQQREPAAGKRAAKKRGRPRKHIGLQIDRANGKRRGANGAAKPPRPLTPWWLSPAGISAKGLEQDMQRRDDETFETFTARLYARLGEGPWTLDASTRIRKLIPLFAAKLPPQAVPTA